MNLAGLRNLSFPITRRLFRFPSGLQYLASTMVLTREFIGFGRVYENWRDDHKGLTRLDRVKQTEERAFVDLGGTTFKFLGMHVVMDMATWALELREALRPETLIKKLEAIPELTADELAQLPVLKSTIQDVFKESRGLIDRILAGEATLTALKIKLEANGIGNLSERLLKEVTQYSANNNKMVSIALIAGIGAASVVAAGFQWLNDNVFVKTEPFVNRVLFGLHTPKASLPAVKNIGPKAVAPLPLYQNTPVYPTPSSVYPSPLQQTFRC